MYINLALKNVKKSYKDYFVYFITLTVSISLFYLFNSFDAQQSVIVTDPEIMFAFGSLQTVMKVISIFVTFVFGFLILYANNFLLKRRKKELALYTLLGMKKKNISRVMVYETFIVGFVSLVTGSLLGIILSQGAAAFSANLVKAEIDYTFIISKSALIFTIINTSIIFSIVALFSNIKISRTKLIDLFKANRKNEEVKANNPFVMMAIMLISIIVLAYTYNFIMEPFVLILYLLPILIVGSLCTFGLFYSMAYWLIFITQKIKGYYYNELNTFTIRQISSKINSTYKILAVVSLFMLVSFGALATAFNINSIIDEMIKTDAPYDISFEILHTDDANMDELIYRFNPDQYDADVIKLYATSIMSESIDESMFYNYDNNIFKDYSLNVSLLRIDDYNKARARANESELELVDNEVIYFVPNYLTSAKESIKIFNDEFAILDTDLKSYDNAKDHFVTLSNSDISSGLTIVATDEIIEQLINKSLKDNTYFDTTSINLILDDNVDVQSISDDFNTIMLDLDPDQEMFISVYTTTRTEVEQMFGQATLLITYIGLYLGLTFLIVCVMIIALQLLSEASDNADRYLLLDKIGVSKKLQRKSIFKQNLIYFLLPMIIGLTHSIFGLKSVYGNLAIGGLITSSYRVTLIVISILCVIYLIYFLITYYSSLRMTINSKRK